MKSKKLPKPCIPKPYIDESRLRKCYEDKKLKIKVHVFNGTERICQCKELESIKEEVPIRNGWKRAVEERKKADVKKQAKKKKPHHSDDWG